MIVPGYQFLTDRGKLRDINEDSFFTPDTIEHSLLECNGYLFAVADGMGGHEGGQKASSLVCNALAEFYKISFADEDGPWEFWAKNVLQKMIERIAHYVYGCRYLSEGKYEGMGSTLTGALVLNDLALVFNVGDSRVYHLSASKGFYQVSRDHSKVQALIDQGLITCEGAETHPDAHVVTRSLGMSPAKDDGCPEIKTVHLVGGDQLLLCSDGLSGIVKQDKMAEIMMLAGREIKNATSELIAAALAGGGPDNITAGLVQMWSADMPEEPIAEPDLVEELVDKVTDGAFELKDSFNMEEKGDGKSSD